MQELIIKTSVRDIVDEARENNVIFTCNGAIYEALERLLTSKTMGVASVNKLFNALATLSQIGEYYEVTKDEASTIKKAFAMWVKVNRSHDKQTSVNRIETMRAVLDESIRIEDGSNFDFEDELNN